MPVLAHLRSRFPGIASILRNGAFFAGAQWAEAGLRGLYVLFIGRALGPELYGVWTYTTASYGFALALTLLGLEILAPARLGRDPGASGFLGTTLALRLILLGVAAAGYLVHAFWAKGELLAMSALLLAVPALLGRGVALWSRPVLLGLNKSEVAFRNTFMMRVCEVSAGLTALWLGAGLHVLLIIHAVSWLIEAVVSLRSVRRRLSFTLRIVSDEVSQILRHGPLLGASASCVAFLNAAPVVLTGHYVGDISIVGQIGIATQISLFVMIGVQGLTAAALPALSRAVARGDSRVAAYGAVTAMATACFFGVAIAAAWVGGPWLVATLLGAQFAPAGALLAPALLATALSVLPTGVFQVLALRDRTWPGLISGAAAVLSLVLVLPVFVAEQGAVGAFVAAAISWALRAAIIFAAALILLRGKSA